MRATTPLDIGFPSPLPEWLPDETLFSLACRFHALAGNRLPSTTCQQLFGHARQGSQHDFPARLRSLCERAGNEFEAPRTLAIKRTVLPFYLHFRSRQASETIVQDAISQDRPGSLKVRLGLPTSGFRAHHPLKACPECVAHDRATHGVAYWHLSHQYPGVWVCPTHSAVLRPSNLKSNGVLRFGWPLPEAGQLSELAAVTSRSFTALQQLSSVILSAMRERDEDPVAPATFAAACRLRLFERGALPAVDRLTRLHASAEELVAALRPLRAVPELQGLPASTQAATQHLRNCLREPRGAIHPLRYFAIICWLFENWEDFRAAAAQVNEERPPAPRPPAQVATPDPRQERALALLQQGSSASHCARIVGVDVHTIMHWAASAGIASKRRPKHLRDEALPHLVAALRTGLAKEDAAHAFGVSVPTITRILRTEVGLGEEWRSARLDRARAQARAEWATAVEGGALGVRALRMLHPAAYAWLYRHDREWLRAATAGLDTFPRPQTTHRTDWDARDAELAEAVQHVALEIAQETGRQRIHLWELYQRIPELRAKLGVLQRLPLTLRAIDEARHRSTPRPQSPSLL